MNRFEIIKRLQQEDLDTLVEKQRTYKDSWKNRGGTGAFMMACRKWDRIENICCDHHGYNIFDAGASNTGDVLDDIRDLRAYLYLIESEIEALGYGRLQHKLDLTEEERETMHVNQLND